MSNTPSEFRDHREFIREAKRSKSVLINGLGLGMCIEAILESDVEDITVIENSLDVIALAAAHYEKDPRVKVIHCSAFDYIPPKGLRYGAVWHDIWDNICADNLEEMSKLHRKYGRRTDWQGSWCKEQCKSYR
jgi:spermidine synthase